MPLPRILNMSKHSEMFFKGQIWTIYNLFTVHGPKIKNSYQGLPYWEIMTPSPGWKFADFLHLEKFLPIDSPHQRLVLATLPHLITVFMLYCHVNLTFCCSHCSYIIFILTLYICTCRYLQNVPFKFKIYKWSKSLLLRFPPPNKKSPQKSLTP